MKQIKNIFGIIGISFILLSFSNCGSSKSMDSNYKLVDTPPFVINEVFSQKWVAGTQEGGSGTNIQITLGSIDKEVEIMNVYFGDQISKMHGKSNSIFIGSINNLKNNDVIMDSDPKKEANNTPPVKMPFNLAKNEAVISYKLNGKMEFFKIENIIEKPMLSYPQGNPNSKY